MFPRPTNATFAIPLLQCRWMHVATQQQEPACQSGTGDSTFIIDCSSQAEPWRQELQRRGLLDLVDEAIFCVDVGWRKPAPQIFEHALTRLGVAARRAVFVGDDVRWD